MATPGFAQVTTVDGYDTTGLAINKHATAVTGQGLLVFLAKESDDPVDPPAGWTELGSGAVTDPDPDDDTPLALHCFWKRVGGSDDLYSFTWQEPCYARILLARFTGVASSGSFIDVYDADDNSTLDDETPAVSVTTTGSNRLIVWCATNYWGGSWTMPSNYTSRFAQETMALGTRAQSSAGSTGNVVGLCSSERYSCAFLVALSDTPIGGGGPSEPAYNSGLLPFLLF